jgi:hypothetical protein
LVTQNFAKVFWDPLKVDKNKSERHRYLVFPCPCETVDGMPKAAQVAISGEDQSVLASIHHLLKWKGLEASAKALGKEAGLAKGFLEANAPSSLSELWGRLSTTQESDSESESDSDSDSDSGSDSGSETNRAVPSASCTLLILPGSKRATLR